MSDLFERVCVSCGVEEGQLHKVGCDIERCPFCGSDMINCVCKKDYTPEEWLKIIKQKGRIPHIFWSRPLFCARCCREDMDFNDFDFMVPTAEWNYYIEPAMRGCVLCISCYNEIKALIDNLYYYVNPIRNVIHKNTCKHAVSSNKVNHKGKWVKYNSLQEAEDAGHYQLCKDCFNLPDLS